jgi:hypothetical protein
VVEWNKVHVGNKYHRRVLLSSEWFVLFIQKNKIQYLIKTKATLICNNRYHFMVSKCHWISICSVVPTYHFMFIFVVDICSP